MSTAVCAPYPGKPNSDQFRDNEWWTRINPALQFREYARLIFVSPGKHPDGRDWSGRIASDEGYSVPVGGSPDTYSELTWHPASFVKDGNVNVMRPKGVRWDESKQAGGRFVPMEEAEAAADDGGVPTVMQLPRPKPSESRTDWERRCKAKFSQIDKRKKDYAKLLDSGWDYYAA